MKKLLAILGLVLIASMSVSTVAAYSYSSNYYNGHSSYSYSGTYNSWSGWNNVRMPYHRPGGSWHYNYPTYYGHSGYGYSTYGGYPGHYVYRPYGYYYSPYQYYNYPNYNYPNYNYHYRW